MKLDFDSISSDDRRIILVASDGKYAELKAKIDWKKLIAFAVAPFSTYIDLITSMFGDAAVQSSYLSTTWLGISARTQGQESPFAKGIMDLFAMGEIPIPHLDIAEARARFKFDLAHPQDGTVYLLNPCDEDHYVLAAQANERLAQEKLAAFMELASALGAKRLELIAGEVEATSAKGNAEARLPNAATQLGLDLSFANDGAVQRQVIMEFGKPRRAPVIPEKLEPWLDRDPTLRSMVQTRLAGEALKARVNLAFDETIDIEADVVAKFAGRGLKVGGTYRRVARSRWGFDVEFWPKDD